MELNWYRMALILKALTVADGVLTLADLPVFYSLTA